MDNSLELIETQIYINLKLLDAYEGDYEGYNAILDVLHKLVTLRSSF